MPDVTIIVPIHNDENYVKRCIQSIRNQTMSDFKMILIDDGSTDTSYSMIKDLIESDSNFIVLQQENGGYGSVISKALQMVDTRYFMICDADDQLKQNAVEVLVELAKKTRADIVLGAREDQLSVTRDISYHPGYDAMRVKLQSEKVYHVEDESFGELFFASASSQSKLYRTSLCKKIDFPPRLVYGDHLLFFNALCKAKRVVYTNQALAIYRKRRIARLDELKDKYVGKIQAYRTILEQNQDNKELPDLFYASLFFTFVDCLEQYRNYEIDSSEKTAVGNILNAYRKEISAHPVRVRNGMKQLKVPFETRIRYEVMMSPVGEKMIFQK